MFHDKSLCKINFEKFSFLVSSKYKIKINVAKGKKKYGFLHIIYMHLTYAARISDDVRGYFISGYKFNSIKNAKTLMTGPERRKQTKNYSRQYRKA